MKKYYTVKETAALIGLTEFTVRRMIHNGSCESEKIDGKRLVPVPWVKQYKKDTALASTLTMATEYARQHNVSKQYIFQRINDGYIKAIKIRGRYYIDEAGRA